MNNIILNLKTKYIFGKQVVRNNLATELKKHNVKVVMLLYGGGSIKKNNNLYDDIIEICENEDIRVIEQGGISPNPRDNECANAAELARLYKVDLIIAAGGGSVIDAAKIIAILATNPQYNFDAWKYVQDQSLVENDALKIFSIITLAATGSENNYGSVITNHVTKHKQSVVTPSGLPVVCFADPTYTISLTKWQSGCGIFDIFSHQLELFYSLKENFQWSDNYLIANMKTLINNANILATDLNNYDARANILWTSSWSLNELAQFGTHGGDWKVHRLEHAISGLWDVEHGAGLALLTPVYIKYMCAHNEIFKNKTLFLAKQLFNVNSVNAFIKKIIELIQLYDLPQKWTDFKQINEINSKDIKWLVNHTKSSNIDNLAKIIYRKIK